MTNKMPVIIAASTNGKGIGYAKMEIVDSLNPPPGWGTLELAPERRT